MKKIGISLLALILVLALAGCGARAPEGLRITLNGEAVTELTVKNGTELTGLCAELLPEDYDGSIEWSSDDAGVVKVTETSGAQCTVSAKKTGSAKLTASCDSVTASVRIRVEKNQEQLAARETALTVGGRTFSPEWVNLYFWDCYEAFLSTYGNYAVYYGLDPDAGITSLKLQQYEESPDGTWYGYFLEESVGLLQENCALCDYAEQSGKTLSEAGRAAIDTQLEKISREASEDGAASVDAWLAARYGEGMTEALYRTYLEQTSLADEVYDEFCAGLSYTQEELDAHYAEMGCGEEENADPIVTLRHILIMAEAEEDGSYSEQAREAAHTEAQELLTRWQAEGGTEERFAELAAEYSEDAASAPDGGLYEGVHNGYFVKELNEWLFTEGRAAGDCALVDVESAYSGTHIVLYLAAGEPYRTVLAREDLTNTAVTAWLSGLTEPYPTEPGQLYGQIGIF